MVFNDEYVYSQIGMALVSAQRVEFITKELVSHLAEFDKSVYGITTADFLANSKEGMKSRLMLGNIFKLLKLNPKFVIADELNNYLAKRNLFVHGFWRQYLNSRSPEQMKTAVKFCDDFGMQSNRLESFFKGFTYFLVMRHVKGREEMRKQEIGQWETDFNYFLDSVSKNQQK